MEYIISDKCVMCRCRSGYEFKIDVDDLEKIKPYNWFLHNGRVEGNLGGTSERVMLSRVLMNIRGKDARFVRQKIKGNDYSKENLYIDNSYIDHGDYYEVVSQKGNFLIDKEDRERIERWHWRINTQKYAEAIINGRRIFLHRFLIGAGQFQSFDSVVDHINRDRLDNRKRNLRIVSQKENARNGSGKAGRTSGIPGIYYDSYLKRWRGRYRDGDNVYSVGLHKTKAAAVSELNRCIECVKNGREYIAPSNALKSSTGEKYIHKAGAGFVVSVNGNYLGYSKDIKTCIAIRDAYISQQ